MALISKREILDKADMEIRKKYFTKTASQILNENYTNISKNNNYDIFLSHSYQDAKIILGVKKFLEDFKYSVYVDWIEDSKLDRTKVDSNTAALLKMRMKNCRCLLYVTTDNSSESKWMPWELGYFDGLKNKVAILPINEIPTNNDLYSGQEYLGLYEYIVEDSNELYVYNYGIYGNVFSKWIRE